MIAPMSPTTVIPKILRDFTMIWLLLSGGERNRSTRERTPRSRFPLVFSLTFNLEPVASLSLAGSLVVYDTAVPDPNDPPGMGGDVFVMGDHDDRPPALVE